ncbi:hypothetical protein [Shewanella aquimarina]|uniref:hypothetical protein n=1 Tax=Shewanella aquimarina TaxID=260365 RepID=UPI002014FF1E|nr:hypothetical protein [Shewanella aquimarina]MCL2909909.1 hypothetical protein [Shewanella aquimarina]
MSQILVKFFRKRKLARNNPNKYQAVFDRNQARLRFYIDNGVILSEVRPEPALNFLPWEWFDSELVINQKYCEMQAERELILGDRLDTALLAQALGYGYCQSAIAFKRQSLYPSRFGREFENGVMPESVFNLCIAELLGLSAHAQNLGRFYRIGYPRNWLLRSKSHLSDFVVLLHSAYVGAPVVPTVDKFAYADIVAHWDTRDLDQVCGFLQQLCDDQMLQVVSPPSKFFVEMGELNWQFIPYPALLLLKLRQNRGLANPEFEHPAFGLINRLLPQAPQPLVVDETLSAWLTRAREQGFDEDALFASCE